MRAKKPHTDINSFIWAHWHSRSDARLGIPRAADAAPVAAQTTARPAEQYQHDAGNEKYLPP